MRTLFVSITLLAGLLAWLAKPVGREIRWLFANYPVERAGGRVAWFADADRAPESAASIDFSNAGVRDEELHSLSRFPNIKTLLLTDTKITDAALDHLMGLRSLEWLDLRGTQITPEGIAKLQRALPNTEIGY